MMFMSTAYLARAKARREAEARARHKNAWTKTLIEKRRKKMFDKAWAAWTKTLVEKKIMERYQAEVRRNIEALRINNVS